MWTFERVMDEHALDGFLQVLTALIMKEYVLEMGIWSAGANARIEYIHY